MIEHGQKTPPYVRSASGLSTDDARQFDVASAVGVQDRVSST